MAAAVVQLQVATGTGPTFANGEGGFKYNREDTISGTTAIPIPTTSGTNYSWLKWLALVVTTNGTTTISNRRIQLSATESAGLGIFFQGNATYAQASSGNQPSAGANGPATPAGFTRATTSLQVYDSTGVGTASPAAPTRNGNYCETVVGVSNPEYVGSAGTTIGLPDIRLVYDEA